MNREQLKKIDHLLSSGDIIAKEENKYTLTDKAVIKLINEIEKLSHPLEAEVMPKIAEGDLIYQFAGRIARAMKHLSSSHVYFTLQTAFGNEERWEDVDEILKQVISLTKVDWQEPKKY